jgi:hypothetical protein
MADQLRERRGSRVATAGTPPVKITVSTTVERSLANVWHWYAVEHVRNHPRWDPEMELEQISEGPIGLGTSIRRRNRHFDEPVDGEMQIIEWKPEQAMGVEIHDANLETVGRVTFEALGPARTRLTIAADFPGMDEATAQRIRPRMDRTARNIRQLIESDDQSAFPSLDAR